MAAIDFFEGFDYTWAQDGDTFGWESGQWKQGWATIGDDKPTVGQFNNTHQIIDQKANYLYGQLKTAADDRSVSTSKSKDDTLLEILNDQRDALLEAIYPVGSVYINASSSTNPGDWLPGTWSKISDGTLYSHGAPKSGTLGNTGGSASVTLTTSQMPKHKHSASTGSAGSHSHTRGSMNIKGSYENRNFGNTDSPMEFGQTGAFKRQSNTQNPNGVSSVHSTKFGDTIHFDAARSWSGRTNKTGSHTHKVNIGDTGGGNSHENMPPFVTVYMWKRVS